MNLAENALSSRKRCFREEKVARSRSTERTENGSLARQGKILPTREKKSAKRGTLDNRNVSAFCHRSYIVLRNTP